MDGSNALKLQRLIALAVEAEAGAAAEKPATALATELATEHAELVQAWAIDHISHRLRIERLRRARLAGPGAGNSAQMLPNADTNQANRYYTT